MNDIQITPQTDAFATASSMPPFRSHDTWRDLLIAAWHRAVMRRYRVRERCGTDLITVAEARPALEDFEADY